MRKIFSECKLPQIHRASAYYLYDRTGRRYLDFWQGDGSAVLGHKPLNTMKQMKNLLSRGVWNMSSPIEEQRLCKAVQTLLPGWYPWLLCSTLQEAMDHVREREGSNLSVRDPLLEQEGVCMLWRPFLGETIPPSCQYLLPVLPFPWSPKSWIVCTRERQDFLTSFSPVLCVALRRATYDLIHALKHDTMLPSLSTAHWKQTGRYLVYIGDSYVNCFYSLLREGIIISPYQKLAISPPRLTENELRGWTRQGLDKIET